MIPSRILVTGHDGDDKEVSIGSEIFRVASERWPDAEIRGISDQADPPNNIELSDMEQTMAYISDYNPDLIFNNSCGNGGQLQIVRESIKRDPSFCVMVTTGSAHGMLQLTGDNEKMDYWAFTPQRAKDYCLDQAKLIRECLLHRNHPCYTHGQDDHIEGLLENEGGATPMSREELEPVMFGEHMYWTHFILGMTRTASMDNEGKYARFPMLDAGRDVAEQMCKVISKDGFLKQWVVGYEPRIWNDNNNLIACLMESQAREEKTGW